MRSVLLFLVLALTAVAAPPKAVPLEVAGDTVTVVKSFPFTITAAFKENTSYFWQFPSSFKAVRNRNVLTVQAAPEGTHTIICNSVTVDFDKKTMTDDIGETVVNVGKLVPPTPPPGPDPPVPPTPPPGPVPIPGEGLRVLMLYESTDIPKLAESQRSVLFSKKVRDYLNAKCPPGPDGKTKEWRVWDKDSDATGEAKIWQDALARPAKSMPWVVISNGKTGYEGPMPTTVEGMLALLKKYGE